MTAARITSPFILLLLVAQIFLFGSTDVMAGQKNARIFAMGDSLLAVHQLSGQSVAQSVAKDLGEPVMDRSVPGARLLYMLPISGALGMNISKQYRRGKWDWVILNGGGNDLWLGCGCAFCKGKINRMISDDGQKGVIPRLVSKLRKDGARVIYVGYLRSPGVGSIIDYCKGVANKFEGRIASLANRDDGVYFLSLVDLVPWGDRSYHALDMIHPSKKGSKAIGDLVANIIQTTEAAQPLTPR